MKTVFIFLITGFEEIEVVTTVDILRRGGVDVTTVSLTGEIVVTGAHNIPVVADAVLETVEFGEAAMLVIPGGTPAYYEHEGMKEKVRAFYGDGGKVAAICAGPAVLGGLGILQGREATCYPGYEPYLQGALLRTDSSVVVDGNVITGKGPGLTVDFALRIVEILAGKTKSEEVAGQLLV